jgi:hypothetical protein
LFRKFLEDVADTKQPENPKTRTKSGKKQTQQTANYHGL